MSTPEPAPRPDAADRYLADVYRRHEAVSDPAPEDEFRAWLAANPPPPRRRPSWRRHALEWIVVLGLTVVLIAVGWGMMRAVWPG